MNVDEMEQLTTQSDQAAQIAAQGRPKLPAAPLGKEPELWGLIKRPTDRPAEPITTGMPFGAGSMWTRTPGEDVGRYRQRVAQALETSPDASPAVKKLAQRLREARD